MFDVVPKMNNIKEVINRGFNLLAISIVGLASFAFLPEVFVEKDMPDKIDDTLLFILGIVAMFWYKKSNNSRIRSIIPVVFVLIGLVIKIIGIIIEHGDAEALGDDMGGLILFVGAITLMIFQYKKTKKILGEIENK